MQIFISFASEDRDLADRINLALGEAGHQVFFDRQSLPASGAYHQRIRGAIERSDLVVFLISPESISAGSYTLTELKYTRAMWPHPNGHVLPVIVRPVPWESIPPYLQAVTILQPEGDIAAEVLFATSDSRLQPAPATRLEDPPRPRVALWVEWKRKREPDSTPRRWVVYIENGADVAITVKRVVVKTPASVAFPIDWGVVPAHSTEDYELDESDFDPSGDRPEASMRFIDAEVRHGRCVEVS